MVVEVAVVGAGVVGLSSALCVQRAVPQARVTVVADRFYHDTTSYGAGGIFRPTLEKTPGIPLSTVKRWLQDSWAHYHTLAHSPEAQEAGVMVASGYQFFNNDREDPLYKDICYHFRDCTQAELDMFPGKKYKRGWFHTGMVTQCKFYLLYLMKRIQQNGGKFETRQVKSFEEFAGKYDVVVNCAALGNRTLVADKKITSIRGQLWIVKAPWIKHFIYHGDNSYIIPLLDSVAVGGVKQLDNFDLRHSQTDARAIMEDAIKIVPSLKDAEVITEWVGLRPHRQPLRLELETMTFNGAKVKVVHNYGHGAEGVSLSWGTALHATRLVQEALQDKLPVTSKL